MSCNFQCDSRIQQHPVGVRAVSYEKVNRSQTNFVFFIRRLTTQLAKQLEIRTLFLVEFPSSNIEDEYSPENGVSKCRTPLSKPYIIEAISGIL